MQSIESGLTLFESKNLNKLVLNSYTIFGILDVPLNAIWSGVGGLHLINYKKDSHFNA